MRKVILGFLLSSCVAFAQAPPQPAISAPALYRAFSRHVVFLDQKATDLDLQGRNGEELRSYYKEAVRLSDEKTALLKQNAAACVNAVLQVDQKAQRIIEQFRAQFPGGSLPSHADLPPVPPELAQLTQEREAVSNGCIQTLQTALGPEAFAKLDDYVQNSFSWRVSTVPIVPQPRPDKPLGRP